MDDSYSWADTVDVWNGVEDLSEEEQEKQEEQPVPKQKSRRKKSVEEHFDEEPESYFDGDSPEPDEDDEDDEDIVAGSVQKAVLFVLIGCLAVVLVIMLIVAFNMISKDKKQTDPSNKVTVSASASNYSTSQKDNTNPVTTESESIRASESVLESITDNIVSTEDISTSEYINSSEDIETIQASTPQAADPGVLSEGGMTYQVQNGAATLTDAKSMGGVVTIPQQVNGVPVSFIADGAFQGNAAVSKIIVPNGVITIGVDAFNGCSALTEIVIPDSVKLIGEGAFNYCPKFVIYCNPGSYAESFCTRWNVEHRPIN